MKTQTPTILLALCLMICSWATFAQDQKYITAYSGDFSGLKYEYGIGRYDNQYMALSSTSYIKSLRIPEGMKVILFSEDNFKGDRLVLTKDTRESELAAKGFTSITLSLSMIVEENKELPADSKIPSIVIYKDNFSGANKRLTTGRFDMSELGDVGNDNLSSVKIPKGFKVTLFENQNFSGRSLVLLQDANSDFLLKNKFNDLTTSLVVEEVPVEPVKETPTVVVPEKTPVVEEPTKVAEPVDNSPGVRIFQGDFSGTSQKLDIGTYDVRALTIGNNELSSIKISEGYRATLYDGEEFNGQSYTIDEKNINALDLEKAKFNNLTSSIVVELIPRVTVFENSFAGTSKHLLAGNYHQSEMGIANDQLSSITVPKGMWALLFEHDNFTGKSLLLNANTDAAYLRNRGFDNFTSSVIVGSGEPLPQITIYQNDFSGASQKLTPGKYEHADWEMGNNALSSLIVPRGFRVTLYENSDFTGRQMKITGGRYGADFMNAHEFNDITSSLVVEMMKPEELVVKIYSDRYSGREQMLGPGTYFSTDITIGERTLTSVKVPAGMQVTLFETPSLSGIRFVTSRNIDFTGSRQQDNYFQSIKVEDVSQPEVTPPASAVVPKKDSVITPVKEEEVIVTPAIPDCTISEKEYYAALKSIQSKGFDKEKMEIATMATKDKCLSNEQIREIASQFSFEDQVLAYLKFAYDSASEKSTYYTLENLLKFMSTQEEFMNFLKSRK